LNEEYGLSVFKRMVLKKLLGPKREKVTGDVRNLHSEVLYDFYPHPVLPG